MQNHVQGQLPYFGVVFSGFGDCFLLFQQSNLRSCLTIKNKAMKNGLTLFLLILFSGICVSSPAQMKFREADNKLSGPISNYTLRTIKLPTGVQLQYAEQGDADGIPVILLHGFTDSWHSYEMVLPHLPPSLHVFAVSQRGHGNSSKPAGDYGPDDFANDIAAFIKQLKLTNALLVGHSMGSTIVQSFAVKYPELTKGIVLVGSFADYNKPEIKEFKTVIEQLKDPIDSVFAADFQKSTIIKPVSEAMLAQAIQESLKVPAYVWKGVAAGWEKSGFVNKLRQFNKPALIVWGDKDLYCSRADQDLLKNAIKNSNLLVYEGTGHALHWEEPVRFANDLLNFINKLYSVTKKPV